MNHAEALNQIRGILNTIQPTGEQFAAIGVAIEAMMRDVTSEQAAENWKETAAQHCRNEDFYRSLLDDVAVWLGPAAYTADDGVVHEDALRIKIPELVEALVRRTHAVVKEVASNDPESFADVCPVCRYRWWIDNDGCHDTDCDAVALYHDLDDIIDEPEAPPPPAPVKPDRSNIVRGCQVRNTATGSRRWVYNDDILANVLGSEQWVYDGPDRHWDNDYSYLCGYDSCRCVE